MDLKGCRVPSPGAQPTAQTLCDLVCLAQLRQQGPTRPLSRVRLHLQGLANTGPRLLLAAGACARPKGLAGTRAYIKLSLPGPHDPAVIEHVSRFMFTRFMTFWEASERPRVDSCMYAQLLPRRLHKTGRMQACRTQQSAVRFLIGEPRKGSSVFGYAMATMPVCRSQHGQLLALGGILELFTLILPEVRYAVGFVSRCVYSCSRKAPENRGSEAQGRMSCIIHAFVFGIARYTGAKIVPGSHRMLALLLPELPCPGSLYQTLCDTHQYRIVASLRCHL